MIREDRIMFVIVRRIVDLRLMAISFLIGYYLRNKTHFTCLLSKKMYSGHAIEPAFSNSRN